MNVLEVESDHADNRWEGEVVQIRVVSLGEPRVGAVPIANISDLFNCIVKCEDDLLLTHHVVAELLLWVLSNKPDALLEHTRRDGVSITTSVVVVLLVGRDVRPKPKYVSIWLRHQRARERLRDLLYTFHAR